VTLVARYANTVQATQPFTYTGTNEHFVRIGGDDNRCARAIARALVCIQCGQPLYGHVRHKQRVGYGGDSVD
jgi:hypothetical protein